MIISSLNFISQPNIMFYVFDFACKDVSFLLERAFLLLQQFRLFYQISCVISVLDSSFFKLLCQSSQIQHFLMKQLITKSSCLHFDVRNPTHHCFGYFSTSF